MRGAKLQVVLMLGTAVASAAIAAALLYALL